MNNCSVATLRYVTLAYILGKWNVGYNCYMFCGQHWLCETPMDEIIKNVEMCYLLDAWDVIHFVF